MYFFATRALFYFTLLLRDKLEYAEKILILRWEIISYLLTLIASVVVGRRAPRALAGGLDGRGAGAGRARRAHAPHPGGGDRRRGPEQGPPDGGGDRQQRHAAGLVRPDRAAGVPAARLGRLPDLPRRRRRARRWPIAARSGGPDRGEPPEGAAPFRAEAIARAGSSRSRTRGPIRACGSRWLEVGSLVVHPIRFGDELLGTVEVDHPKRHAYGAKDLTALSTLGNQIATAIHIAELRRPLLGTVEQIGQQVTALARVTESLRASALGAGRRVAGHAAGRGRAGDLRRRRPPGHRLARRRHPARWPTRAPRPRRRAAPRRRWRRRSGSVIGEAIDRLVGLKGFVVRQRRPGGRARRDDDPDHRGSSAPSGRSPTSPT